MISYLVRRWSDIAVEEFFEKLEAAFSIDQGTILGCKIKQNKTGLTPVARAVQPGVWMDGGGVKIVSRNYWLKYWHTCAE